MLNMILETGKNMNTVYTCSSNIIYVYIYIYKVTGHNLIAGSKYEACDESMLPVYSYL